MDPSSLYGEVVRFQFRDRLEVLESQFSGEHLGDFETNWPSLSIIVETWETRSGVIHTSPKSSWTSSVTKSYVFPSI
jgi:hypothetical protein